jgi:hypothetical protein
MERLTDKKENLIFETEPKLFSIGIITLLEEMVSLNVGMLEIRSTKEYDPKQGTSNQTMKSKDFFVKLEVSLEDKVSLDPKTYYHYN